MQIIDRKSFDKLIDVLQARGFEVLGPIRRDGAVVRDRLKSASEMHIGRTDRQAPRTCRLVEKDYAVGPHSWKKLLLPPTPRLQQSRRAEKALKLRPNLRNKDRVICELSEI
jgi:sulfhydrogenase subunit beta (sulfur reductase)